MRTLVVVVLLGLAPVAAHPGPVLTMDGALDAPTAWSAAVAHKDQSMIFGGQLPGPLLTDRAYLYGQATDGLTPLPPLPTPAAHIAAATFGSDVYLFGGLVASPLTGTDDAYRFNLTSGTYTQVADLPWTVFGMTAVSAGAFIYLFGGRGCPAPCPVLRYEPSTDTYTTLTATTPPLWGMAGVWVGDILLFGGWQGSAGSIVADVRVFDRSLEDFRAPSPSLPHPLHGAGVVLFDGTIFVLGGYNATADAPSDEILTYTRPGGAVPYGKLPRPSHTSSFSGGLAPFVFGGGSATPASQVETYCLACLPHATIVCTVAEDSLGDVTFSTTMHKGLPLNRSKWDFGDGFVHEYLSPGPATHYYYEDRTHTVRVHFNNTAAITNDQELDCVFPPNGAPILSAPTVAAATMCEGVRIDVTAFDPEDPVDIVVAASIERSYSFDGATFTWAPPHEGTFGPITFTAREWRHGVLAQTTSKDTMIEVGPCLSASTATEGDADRDGAGDGADACPHDAAQGGCPMIQWNETTPTEAPRITPRCIPGLPKDPVATWDDVLLLTWTYDGCQGERMRVNAPDGRLVDDLQVDGDIRHATMDRAGTEGDYVMRVTDAFGRDLGRGLVFTVPLCCAVPTNAQGGSSPAQDDAPEATTGRWALAVLPFLAAAFVLGYFARRQR